MKLFYTHCPCCHLELFLKDKVIRDSRAVTVADNQTSTNLEVDYHTYWRCETKSRKCPVNFYQHQYSTEREMGFGKDVEVYDEHFNFTLNNILVRVYPEKGIYLYPLIDGGWSDFKPSVKLPMTTIDFSDVEALKQKVKMWMTFS